MQVEVKTKTTVNQVLEREYQAVNLYIGRVARLTHEESNWQLMKQLTIFWQ